MYKVLSRISEFLPRRVKRAALLRAMLLHGGIKSETEAARIFKEVGLHPTTTSDWLAKEALPDLKDLPNTQETSTLVKWVEQLPTALKYETLGMLQRDVTINCRLVNRYLNSL